MQGSALQRRSFIPPRPQRGVIVLAQRIAPWLYRLFLGAHLEVGQQDVARLRALRGQGGLVVLNHPTIYDPIFAFGLSRYAGEPWFYLCALESFREVHPLTAHFMTWVGAYSVRRGTLDRPSVEMTRRLLVEDRKVVLFAEGETYGLNDTLLPFQEGAVQIGFWALEDREKRGRKGPLWLIPVAIKYRLTGDVTSLLEARLRSLEVRLGLPVERGNFLRRLMRIGDTVLERLEREYQVTPPQGDLNARIAFLRHWVLERVAQTLKVRLRPEWTLQEKIRALFNAVNEFLYGEEALEVPPEWEEALRLFHRDVARLHAFQAVQEGYVLSYPSPERFLDLLSRLEWEMTGQAPFYRPRSVLFSVGEPLDLGAFREAYRSNKRETVRRLTEEVRTRVKGLLRRLIARTQPLPGMAPRAAPSKGEEVFLTPEGA